MKEFKFIRGKYTNESIFDSNVTENALFAYDGTSQLIGLDTENNQDFQNYIARIANDRVADIYTFFSSQFSFRGELTRPDGGDPYYRFIPTTKEHPSQDSNVTVPSDVRAVAQNYLASHLTTNANPAAVSLYINDDEMTDQAIKFIFNNDENKAFFRTCHFKLSGTLKERGYGPANGRLSNVYLATDNKISSDFNEDGSEREIAFTEDKVFHNGRVQKTVEPLTVDVIIDTQALGNATEIGYAAAYTAASGYSIISDNQPQSSVGYNPNTEIDVYKNIYKGLVTSSANSALNAKTSSAERTTEDTLYSLANGILTAHGDTDALAAGSYYKIYSAGTTLAYSNTDGSYTLVDNNLYRSMPPLSIVSVDSTVTYPEESDTRVVIHSSKKVASLTTTITDVPATYDASGAEKTKAKKLYTINATYDDATTPFTSTVDSSSYNGDNNAFMGAINGILDGFVIYEKVNDADATDNTTYYVYDGNVTFTQKAVCRFTYGEYVVKKYYRTVKSGYRVYGTDVTLTKYAVGNVYIEPTNVESVSIVSCDSKGNVTGYNYYQVTEDDKNPIAYNNKVEYRIPTLPTDRALFIKDYNDSFSGFYVLEVNSSKPDESSLRTVQNRDLVETTISVYSSSRITNVYCYGDAVYEDDSDDTHSYVAYNTDWSDEKTFIGGDNRNVEIGDGNIIRPKITSTMDRKIIDYSVAVSVD